MASACSKDQLNTLKDNERLSQELEEATTAGSGRQLAEMLAATAVPWMATTAPTMQNFATKHLASNSCWVRRSNLSKSTKGSAVLATMVAERRVIGENYKKSAVVRSGGKGPAPVGQRCRFRGAPEGEESDDALGEAVVNLRRDLEATPDLNPDGTQGVLNDLSVDGAQVISQLVEDRKEAERRADSASMPNDALPKGWSRLRRKRRRRGASRCRFEQSPRTRGHCRMRRSGTEATAVIAALASQATK